MGRPRLLALAGLLLLLAAALPVTAAPRTDLNDTWIAFSSQAEGEAGIWVVHPDGSDLHRLTEGNDTYPSWSPDGTLLAYVHEVRSGGADPGAMDVAAYTSEVRIVDLAGNLLWTVWPGGWAAGEAQGTRSGNCGAPQWSSDGQAISFSVDMQFFFIFAWGGRRTFYLAGTPRLEFGRGPDLNTGSVLLDQSWAPGPVPTWVRVGLDMGNCQLMAYDQAIVRTADSILFNPRWSPSGQSLTYYEQVTTGSTFRNGLVQVSATGQVERTLLESTELALYDSAEWSPDGRRHLVGTSADWTSWLWMLFLQSAGVSSAEGSPAQPLSILPATPPDEGYLYVLEADGSKAPVAAPAAGTIDLISRQPWGPDGRQVVFMRAPHPAGEPPASDVLGIYVGAPGAARRIVRFVDSGSPLSLTMAYPAWQPVPQGPLPTMVPLGTLGQGPAGGGALPTTAPTLSATPSPPRPTATHVPSPTATRAARTAAPLSPTLPGAAAAQPPQTNLRTYLLIGAGVLIVVLITAIVWTLLRPPRSSEGARPARTLRLIRRGHPSGAAAEQAAAAPTAAEEDRPARRFRPFGRRRPPETGGTPPPAPPAEAVTAPEAVSPSLLTRQGRSADWPDADIRPAPRPPERVPAPQPDAAAAPAEGLMAAAAPPEGPAPPAEEAGSEERAAGSAGPTCPPEPATIAPPAPAGDPLLQQGIAQVKAGDASSGFATLRQVVERTPQEAEAWLWLGWAAACQQQRDVAERCFQRAQQLGRSEQAAQALAWLSQHR